MHEATTDRVGTGALARPSRAQLDRFVSRSYRVASLRRAGEGARPHVVRRAQRGKGPGIDASA